MLVGGYRVVRRIGEGSTGVVYEATGAGGVRVALKVLAASGDPGAAESLCRAIASPAVRHRGVLHPLEVFGLPGGLVAVYELVSGGSLADTIARRGFLGPLEVARGAALVAEALAALHEAGVAHGDVKPGNILFRGSGRPVLNDVGLGRWVSGAGPAWPAVVATAEYAAPEVGAGCEPGAASDVYGLGVSCWEALVGRPPFRGRTPLATIRAAAKGHAPSPATLRADIPPTLAAAVMAAMAPGPRDRPTAAELAALARDAVPACRPAAGHGTSSTLVAAVGPPRPRGQRSPTALAAGGAPSVAAPPTARRRRRRLVRAVGAAVLLLAATAGIGARVLGRMTGAPGLAQASPGRPARRAPGRSNGGACGREGRAAPSEVLLADAFGTGCVLLEWADGSLTVRPTKGVGSRAIPGGVARRFSMGRPGDELLVGDWGCGSGEAPALYRPSTGQVFIWRAWASPGHPLSPARVLDTGALDAVVTVAASGRGCDKVVVQNRHLATRANGNPMR